MRDRNLRILLAISMLIFQIQIIEAQSTITYYFNSYNNSNWDSYSDGPINNLIDSSTDTYTRDNNDGHYIYLNGNSYSGSGTGNIVKVELRVRFKNNYNSNSSRTVFPRLIPYFNGTNAGSSSNYSPGDYDGPGFPFWSDYFDITNITNAPTIWSWNDIQNLDCRLETARPNSGMLYVYKIEIRVSYGNCVVPTAPNISAFPPIVLAGEMTTLTGGYSGGTLTWYEDDCGSGLFATGASVEVSPLIPKTYYARVENGFCVSDCDTVNVIVAQPCHLEASANGVFDTLNICSGDNVDLKGIGSCSYLMDNSFDEGMGVGWESNANPQFNNPCLPSFDGTTYLWIGSSASFPRDLITEEYAVTEECQICFDFVMATQSQSSPCEGPDEMDEGVSLQWSIDDGDHWTDITYFCPNGHEYDRNFWVGTGHGGGGYGTPFNEWDNYCYSVPAAAVSEHTKFRFHQEQVTSQVFDHWGLDNVEISCPTPTQVVQWSHGPTDLDPSSNVSPTSSTSYKVIIDDGLGFGNADTAEVHVHIIGTPTVNDDNACSPGENVTLSASGVGTLKWYDNAIGGAVLHTGNNFNINNLTAPRTLYVSEEAPNFPTITYDFNSNWSNWTPSSCVGNNWSWHNSGIIYFNDTWSQTSNRISSPGIDVSSWHGSLSLSIRHRYNIKSSDDAMVCYRVDGGAWQYKSLDGANFGVSWIYKDPFTNCNNSNSNVSNKGNQSGYVTNTVSLDVSSADLLEISLAYSSYHNASNGGYWNIDQISVSGGGIGSCSAARAEVHAGITELNIDDNIESVKCTGNNDGEATAIAVDGLGMPLAGIYSYTWDNGETTSSIDDLPAGTYEVTVADEFGCNRTKTIDIPEPLLPTALANTSGISGTCNIESPDEWVHIVNEHNSNEIIASVFDANGGNHLFTTESEITLYGAVQYHNDEPYLQRVVRITPSIQGAADIKIYFTQAEFDALRAKDPSITSISQLGVTKCDESGTWSNCMVVPNSQFHPSPDMANVYYAEFSISSFSTFYIHKYSGFPLPVQLTDFSGHCTNVGASLTWSTSSEVNNDYFILERSSDLENFEFVTQIDGNGNSNETIQYGFEDLSYDSEKKYYRLLQVDYDGQYEYHPSIVINCDDNNSGTMKVYQCSDHSVMIKTKFEPGTYVLYVMDNAGRQLINKTVVIENENYNFTLEDRQLIEGMYYIRLQNQLYQYQEKVIIQY